MAKHDIQYVLDGEKVSRTISVDGDVVSRHHVTAHKTGKVACTWRFDFTGVDQGTILELASRSVLIGSRPTFKDCPTSDIPDWLDRTISVQEFASRERKCADPKQKIVNLMSGLSPDERDALIEKLKQG